MKKKTMSLLLAAATALGMLAGCGGGNGEPSGGSQSAGADAGQESGEIKTINMSLIGWRLPFTPHIQFEISYLLATIVNSPGIFSFAHAGCSSNLLNLLIKWNYDWNKSTKFRTNYRCWYCVAIQKRIVNFVNLAIIKIWVPDVKNCIQRGKVWQ